MDDPIVYETTNFTLLKQEDGNYVLHCRDLDRPLYVGSKSGLRTLAMAMVLDLADILGVTKVAEV